MYLYETGDDKHTLCTVYFAVKQFCMSRVKRPHQCMLKERRTSPWVEICPLARIQEYQR